MTVTICFLLFDWGLFIMVNVLVVDDDKDMCELISYVLKNEGCHVNKAFNGEVALKKIKNQPYDVMILDYVLPGQSGLTILEETRKTKPSIKTIMMSGFANDATKARANELGAYDFLDKPLDIDRLLKDVQKNG